MTPQDEILNHLRAVQRELITMRQEMATKQDLQQLATKQDVKHVEKTIETAENGIIQTLSMVIHEAVAPVQQNHEERIQRIENTLELPSLK